MFHIITILFHFSCYCLRSEFCFPCVPRMKADIRIPIITCQSSIRTHNAQDKRRRQDTSHRPDQFNSNKRKWILFSDAGISVTDLFLRSFCCWSVVPSFNTQEQVPHLQVDFGFVPIQRNSIKNIYRKKIQKGREVTLPCS